MYVGSSAIQGQCGGGHYLNLLKVQESCLLQFGDHFRLRLTLVVGQQGFQVEQLGQLAQRGPHLSQELQLLCSILQLSLQDLAVDDAYMYRHV